MNRNTNFPTVLLKHLFLLFCCTCSSPLFAQPQFGACSDIEFCGTQINCAARNALSNTVSGNCNPAEDLVVDFKIDLNDDGLFDYLGSNVSPYPFPNPNGLPIIFLSYSDTNGDGTFDGIIDSLDYPVGDHRVIWSASDECINTATCNYLFAAKDCTAPVAKALDNFYLNIDWDCEVELDAWMLDDGSFDNCCLEPDSFRIRFPWSSNQPIPPMTSRLTFDNNERCRRIPVDFWVMDCQGNWAFTTTLVSISDEYGYCEGSFADIRGIVATEDGILLEHLSIRGISSGIYCNSNNDFYLEVENIPGWYHTYAFAGCEYLVAPEKDDNHRNGISVADIILLSRHLIGLQSLDSPYKLIAADIDNSGDLSTFDIIEMQKLLLFINDSLTNNSSWRFIYSDHVFTDPKDPWGAPELEGFTWWPFGCWFTVDFVAMKIGDLNGNAATDLKKIAADRNFQGELQFQTKDINLKQGEEYLLNFSANSPSGEEAILGYQYSLEFDPDVLEIVGVENNKWDTQFGWSKIEEGILLSSYAGAQSRPLSKEEVLLSLRVKAKANSPLSEILQINSRFTSAEAYNEKLELMKVDLAFLPIDLQQTKLYQNQPNPFSNNTNINFYLPASGKATLNIFNSAGKLVQSSSQFYDKGQQEIELNETTAWGNGIYYYQLETEQSTLTKKMVLLK